MATTLGEGLGSPAIEQDPSVAQIQSAQLGVQQAQQVSLPATGFVASINNLTGLITIQSGTSSSGVTVNVTDDGVSTISIGVSIPSLAGLTTALAAWASWTPSWTNLSVGDGTVVAKYLQLGKTIYGRLSIVFGSTTSVSGAIIFSLPQTAVSYAGTAGVTWIGGARARTTTGPAIYNGTVAWKSTTTAEVDFEDSSGTYVTSVASSATIPFTWATGDEIGLELFYEAA